MFELEGYVVGEVLHAGDRSLVVRAERVVDGAPVVLKTTALAQPSTADLRRLEAEYALASRVCHPGLTKVLALERHEHRSVLVLEEGGSSLDLLSGPLELAELLHIALSLADALGALHEAGIAHRDVNPTNVLRDEAGTVRLCDFGLASLLARQDLSVEDAAHLEGTLR